MPKRIDALRSAGLLLDTVVDSMSDIVFVLDSQCRYYGIWGRWLAEHDLSAADFIGKTCEEVWGAEEAEFFREVNEQAMSGETVVFERWFDMPWGPVYYQTRLSPLRDDDSIIGICGIRRDITDLKQAEDVIRREREYAQHVIDSANVMIVGLDGEGIVRLFNNAAEEITGYRHDEIIGKSWFETICPAERFPAVLGAFRNLYQRTEDDVRPHAFRRCSESPILTKSGEEHLISWMESEVPEADRKFDVVCFGIDVTENRQHQQQLEHLATHDPLTDLPNRRSFERALSRAVARAHRGTCSAVLFIDVDDFKLCNDEHGHAFGDAVLSEIARALEGRVREPDVVARIGGDEFATLLEGASVAEAVAVAERMRSDVQSMAARRGISLDLSIGVMGMDEATDYERVLTGADTAMYASKRTDAGVIVYEPEST
ncbi:MAG: diguanylate cyclase [Coriobacteriia bacterium]|nr:diguanylate cyclase [Coriobacteriia bacterium]